MGGNQLYPNVTALLNFTIAPQVSMQQKNKVTFYTGEDDLKMTRKYY